MMRYIVLTILISVALVQAHKPASPGKRFKQPIAAIVEYDDDYDNEFDYDDYAKDANGNSNQRPWTMSYWGNLLRKTRLPRLNITNPFTKLFNPYVIKVDFPPGTDPNVQPIKNPNKQKHPPQQDYIFVNTGPSEEVPEQDDSQYFYDPVTQQYYEVVESASQDYSPENNYYATTFKDDDEIEINVDDLEDKHEVFQAEEVDASAIEAKLREVKDSEQYIVGVYNQRAVSKSKSKQARGGVRSKIQAIPLVWFNQRLT